MALAFSPSIFPCNSYSSTEFRDSSFRFPRSFHGSRSSIVFSDSKASTVPLHAARELRRRRCAGEKNSSQNSSADEQEEDLGVKAALSLLRFYKREISPLLPSSCRYVPTCSEYSMAAYKKYGVIKGTILTAWRLCRCNPLGNLTGKTTLLQSTSQCSKIDLVYKLEVEDERRTFLGNIGGSGFDPPRWFDEPRAPLE